MGIFPDMVTKTKLTGSVTVTVVPSDGTKTQTVTLGDAYLIIGVPKVSTSTANCEVELVNGGENEFTVKVINNDIMDVEVVVVDYEVVALKSA